MPFVVDSRRICSNSGKWRNRRRRCRRVAADGAGWPGHGQFQAGGPHLKAAWLGQGRRSIRGAQGTICRFRSRAPSDRRLVHNGGFNHGPARIG